MRHNTHALVVYDPDSSPARMYAPPKTIMLRAHEAFVTADGTPLDEFLSDRRDVTTMSKGWEDVLGYSLVTLDIPGNHFEPFNPCYVGRAVPSFWRV